MEMESVEIKEKEPELAVIPEVFDELEVYVERLRKILGDFLGDGDLTPANTAEACLILMKAVEEYRELKGPQKKELVLRVLRRHASGVEKKLDLPTDLLSTMIDILIRVDKKKVIINAKKCLGFCLSLCRK
jgi:hypothetical protein